MDVCAARQEGTVAEQHDIKRPEVRGRVFPNGVERREENERVYSVREPIEDVTRRESMVPVMRSEPVPLFPLDGSAPILNGFQSKYQGDILDSNGIPLRMQHIDRQLLFDGCLKNRGNAAGDKKRVSPWQLPRVKGLGSSSSVLAYANLVKMYAKKYNLRASLILAIIQAESRGRASAIGAQSTMGLMQVMPHTAGKAVDTYLARGKRGKPPAGDLLSPDQNVFYGATYLHILASQVFSRVKNPLSRDICVIAAYNAGPGKLLQHFGADKTQAIRAINRCTPEEVYKDITGSMSRPGTRQYLAKVYSLMQVYAGMGY